MHLLAEPTKLEMLEKEYDKKKEQFKSQVQESILKCYGGDGATLQYTCHNKGIRQVCGSA